MARLKPCSRCGGPKGSGERRQLCDNCRKAGSTCVTCGIAHDGRRRPQCRACFAARMVEERTPLLLRDREWLAAAYSQMPAYRIAALVGCGGGTVAKWLKRLGIPVRTKSEANAFYHATAAGGGHARNRQMVTAGVSDVRGAIHWEPGSTVEHFGAKG